MSESNGHGLKVVDRRLYNALDFGIREFWRMKTLEYLYNRGVGCSNTRLKPNRIGGPTMTPREASYREISLTKGQLTIVDAVDYEWLIKWKWHAQWSKKTRSFYASRSFKKNGQKHHVFMHREILGLVQGDRRVADHKEPSMTLDNRRQNLRICTNSQNTINGRIRRDNVCGIKGVCLDKRRKKWKAEIKADGKKRFLGYFESPELAGQAYKAAAEKYFGEFARQ